MHETLGPYLFQNNTIVEQIETAREITIIPVPHNFPPKPAPSCFSAVFLAASLISELLDWIQILYFIFQLQYPWFKVRLDNLQILVQILVQITFYDLVCRISRQQLALLVLYLLNQYYIFNSVQNSSEQLTSPSIFRI